MAAARKQVYSVSVEALWSLGISLYIRPGLVQVCFRPPGADIIFENKWPRWVRIIRHKKPWRHPAVLGLRLQVGSMSVEAELLGPGLVCGVTLFSVEGFWRGYHRVCRYTVCSAEKRLHGRRLFLRKWKPPRPGVKP